MCLIGVKKRMLPASTPASSDSLFHGGPATILYTFSFIPDVLVSHITCHPFLHLLQHALTGFSLLHNLH